MTHNGYPVVGENGIIRVQQNNFIVNERGEVIINAAFNPTDMVSMANNDWSQPVVLDRLKLVDFEKIRELKKEGDSLWKETEYSGPPLPVGDMKVVQGFLEKSNVNMIREMVDMIEVQRSYEANQKAVQTHDTELGRLIGDIAR